MQWTQQRLQNEESGKTEYSRTTLNRINPEGEPSGYAKNPDNWIFLWKYATLSVWSEEKMSTIGCFRLHIYYRTNKTSLLNSLYVFDSWGKYLSHKKDVAKCSRKMFTGRVKTIRIIGDPDSQLADKWSSTVQLLLRMLAHAGRCTGSLHTLLRLNGTHSYW